VDILKLILICLIGPCNVNTITLRSYKCSYQEPASAIFYSQHNAVLYVCSFGVRLAEGELRRKKNIGVLVDFMLKCVF